MTVLFFHAMATVFFAACLCLLGLNVYYFTLMAHEVDRQLPPSRVAWFFFWFAAPSFHYRFYPESRLRKQWLFSAIGMWVCGFLAIHSWI